MFVEFFFISEEYKVSEKLTNPEIKVNPEKLLKSEQWQMSQITATHLKYFIKLLSKMFVYGQF